MNDETTLESPQDSQGSSQESPQTDNSTPPAINLDTPVRVGGQDIPLSELVKAREDLEYLKQDYSKLVSFRDATTKVMRPDVDPTIKEQAARQLLVDMGYRGDEVDQYVSEWMDAQNQGAEMASDDTTNDEDGGDEDNSAEQVAEAIMRAQQEAQRTSEQLNRMRAEQLNSRMNTQIMMGLDLNPDARTMLGKLEEINGKEASSAARAAFERDIRQQTLENLKNRRAAAGTFEEAWISEESARATNEVLAKYRSVIGDPNRLGRAPETAVGESILSSKPIQAPRWKPGVSAGDIESALDAFNKDALARLAAGTDAGGDKV
jgi:hypothetical protein